MSAIRYRPDTKGPTVNFIGRTEFAQCSAHRPTKSPFGVDTMQIDYRGAVFNLASFMRGLKQGARFDHNGAKWYLQTWSVDESLLWPTVDLVCMGFASGTAPAPIASDAYITQTVTITAQLTETNPTPPPAQLDVNLTREINYRALQTTWSYVTTKRPTRPFVGRTSTGQSPQIVSSSLTASSQLGTRVYNGAVAPARYVSATEPATVDFLMDLNPVPIPGTPFFEVTEVISRIFYAG